MADISYTKTVWVNGSTALNAANLNNIEMGVDNATKTINTKVDKVAGKGLSTNDFSNYYKNAIDNLLYVAPDDRVLNANEMNGTYESGTTVTLN